MLTLNFKHIHYRLTLAHESSMASPGTRITNKMFLSVQRSVAKSFIFRGKNVQSLHVPDLGECLEGIDVSRAIGYADDNNGRRAIIRHIP